MQVVNLRNYISVHKIFKKLVEYIFYFVTHTTELTMYIVYKFTFLLQYYSIFFKIVLYL
jgi:hypothetical protein